MNRKLFTISLLTIAACSARLLATGTEYNQWSGGAGTHDWNNPNNWALFYVPDYTKPNDPQPPTYVKAGSKTPGNGPIVDASTTSARCYQYTLGGTSGGILTISGGTLNIQQFLTMGANSGENGILQMNSGSINTGTQGGSYGIYVGQKGIGDINMVGGTITLTGNLSLGDTAGASGSISISGGTIYAADLLMLHSDGSGYAKIDISGTGQLIITADKTSQLGGSAGWIATNWITAWGGSGTVAYDRTTNPGKTTIWAVSLKATSPGPSNAATNVITSPTLTWNAGSGATSHNVYFDTVNPPVTGPANPTGTSYSPGILASNTTYYWRVDEVSGSGTTTGDVWSFTTGSGQAVNPNPANGSTQIGVNAQLSWVSAGADSHNIYFGTDQTAVTNATDPGTLPGRGNITATTFNPGTLAFSTTYYWRVDEVRGGTVLAGQVWSFATMPQTVVYPYLTYLHDATNSIVVNWWNGNATGNSAVDYGSTSSYGQTVSDPTLTNYHHLEITGLTAGAAYHYRIRSSDGTAGADNTFIVPYGDPNSYTFVVYGDTRGEPTASDPNSLFLRHLNLCNWLATRSFDFAFNTGDFGNNGTDANDWRQFYHDEQTLSRTKVIMPVEGNHEVQGGGSTFYYYSLYQGNSAVPNNGYAGALSGKNYSFNYANAHFVILCLYSLNQSDTTIQTTWLQNDLATASANPNIKWIFAFMHMPLYTAGDNHWSNEGARALWAPIFDQYHVAIVFGGHNHVYERSYAIDNNSVVAPGKGTYYITSGLGGGPFNGFNTASPDAPFFQAHHNNETLAVFITVNDRHLTLSAIANAGEVVYDTMDLSKEPNYLPPDFNKDGIVDYKDLTNFLGSYLKNGLWP